MGGDRDIDGRGTDREVGDGESDAGRGRDGV